MWTHFGTKVDYFGSQKPSPKRLPACKASRPYLLELQKPSSPPELLSCKSKTFSPENVSKGVLLRRANRRDISCCRICVLIFRLCKCMYTVMSMDKPIPLSSTVGTRVPEVKNAKIEVPWPWELKYEHVHGQTDSAE